MYTSAPDKNYKVPGQNTQPLLYMRELCPAKYNYGWTFEFLARNCQMSDCYWEHWYIHNRIIQISRIFAQQVTYFHCMHKLLEIQPVFY